MLNTYTKDTGNVEIKYGQAEDFTEIAEKYHLKDNIDNTSTFAKCVSLMNYQTAHMLHNGGYDNHITDIPGILEYAWDNNIEKSVNCLHLARVLRTFIQSQGIKARIVALFPLTPYEQDNHVVLEAWIEEQHKWVMFDPSYNTYLTDEAGTPLNLAELRTTLGNQQKIIFAPKTAHNKIEKDPISIKHYYAKDCFFFIISDNQTEKEQKKVHNIIIAPDGFDYEKYASIRKFYPRPTIHKPLSFVNEP